MGKQDFEARRDALLQDIRSMMDDVQELYDNSVEEGTKEAKEAKAKLQVKLDAALRRSSSRVSAESRWALARRYAPRSAYPSVNH